LRWQEFSQNRRLHRRPCAARAPPKPASPCVRFAQTLRRAARTAKRAGLTELEFLALAPESGVNPYWRRNLYVCLFGSFVNMAGMTILLPFLPIYIRDLGVRDAHAIVFWSAAAFSASFLAAGLVSPIWGYLADLYGRKPMLIRACLGMTIAISAMGMAQNVYELVALRALAGFLGGYTSGSIILVASQTPRTHSAWALGKLSIGSLSGSLLGPLIGGAAPKLIGLRETFWATGAAIFVAFLLTTFVIREDRNMRPKRENGRLPPLSQIVPDWRPIVLMLASAALLLVANMSVEPIVTLFVSEIARPGQDAVLYAGAAMSAGAFAAMLAAPTIGRLADQRGHWRVVGVCFAAAVNAPWQLVALRFLMGLALAGLMPAITAFIRRNAPDAAIGRILGLSQSAQYFGQIAGPFAGAGVAARFGMRAVFLATAAAMLAAAVANEAMRRRVERQPSNSA
jgi:MFS family permease